MNIYVCMLQLDDKDDELARVRAEYEATIASKDSQVRYAHIRKRLQRASIPRKCVD